MEILDSKFSNSGVNNKRYNLIATTCYLILVVGFLPSLVYYYDYIEYWRITRGGINLPIGPYYSFKAKIEIVYMLILIVSIVLFYKYFSTVCTWLSIYIFILLLIVLLVYNEYVEKIAFLFIK